MYNPDTRKFENLLGSSLGSSLASHAAVAAAAAAAANAFNVAAHQSQAGSTDWYSQFLRWDYANILDSTNSADDAVETTTTMTQDVLWNLGNNDEEEVELCGENFDLDNNDQDEGDTVIWS